MKKLLLAAAVAAVASSAHAEEGTFYVRADVGGSIVPNQTITGSKAKSSKHVVAGLGVGTYLMDNVRTELVLSNHFSAQQKGTAKVGNTDVPFKVKYQVMAVTLKGIVDAFDYGAGKVFIGAGVGLTQLGAKIEAGSATGKAKKKNNFSFLGTVGTSFNVSEGVDLDIAYSYNDHGKTKGIEQSSTKVKFQSHDITGGVRISL